MGIQKGVIGIPEMLGERENTFQMLVHEHEGTVSVGLHIKRRSDGDLGEMVEDLLFGEPVVDSDVEDGATAGEADAGGEKGGVGELHGRMYKVRRCGERGGPLSTENRIKISEIAGIKQK